MYDIHPSTTLPNLYPVPVSTGVVFPVLTVKGVNPGQVAVYLSRMLLLINMWFYPNIYSIINCAYHNDYFGA